MHLVRSANGVIYIDELELVRPCEYFWVNCSHFLQGITNLCSGFSYCLSLLETFYVWHGCGSIEEERRAALEYARGIASDPSSVVELKEGGDDEDEMFWLILGEGEYAKADYWKWKPTLGSLGVRAWLVDADSQQSSVSTLPRTSSLQLMVPCPFSMSFVVRSTPEIQTFTVASISSTVYGNSSFSLAAKLAAREKISDLRLTLQTSVVHSYSHWTILSQAFPAARGCYFCIKTILSNRTCVDLTQSTPCGFTSYFPGTGRDASGVCSSVFIAGRLAHRGAE